MSCRGLRIEWNAPARSHCAGSSWMASMLLRCRNSLPGMTNHLPSSILPMEIYRIWPAPWE